MIKFETSFSKNQKTVLVLYDPEDKNITTIRNAGDHFYVNTA